MAMNVPILTLFYAGLLALFIFPMTYLIIKKRFAAKIGLGTGRHDGLKEERELLKAVRIHGNFIEYVPIILFLFLLLELSQTPNYILHSLGIALVIGRVAHAIGLYKTAVRSWPRAIGMMLTWLVLFLCATGCLYFSVPVILNSL